MNKITEQNLKVVDCQPRASVQAYIFGISPPSAILVIFLKLSTVGLSIFQLPTTISLSNPKRLPLASSGQLSYPPFFISNDSISWFTDAILYWLSSFPAYTHLLPNWVFSSILFLIGSANSCLFFQFCRPRGFLGNWRLVCSLH